MFLAVGIALPIAEGSRLRSSRNGWIKTGIVPGIRRGWLSVLFAVFLISLGSHQSALANLYGTVWDLRVDFWVGSGDYIQMTGDGNGDSFKYADGYFTHNDSTMDFWGNAQIGLNSWAVFYQNGGDMNVGGYLSIARYGGSGYLEVNGGLVNCYNQAMIVGEVGDGSFAVKGGRAYSYQGVALSQNSGSKGTLYLNGGTLEVGGVWKGNGTGDLSFNGGTLKATRDEWNYISGLNSANIGGNGAVIDNNGKGIGINQTLTGSGSGSVKFDGSNWTHLRQNNTYTGDTLVRGGVLNFFENGSLYNNGTAAGNIIVSSGATLYLNRQDIFGNADTGSSSPVSITLNGGTINNGNGGTTGGGVFNNLANLTMNGGTLNASGGDANGWNAYLLNHVTVGGSSASSITANTSLNGNNAILLSRAGTTTFNVGSTGDATGDLKVSARLTDGNGVVGSLTKTGTGKMVLSADNTYTGGTTISGGQIQVGNGGTEGTLGAGNITNNGALVFNRSNDFTNSFAISGAGEVKQIGKGTTVLTGNHTYTGPTTISDGVLFVKNGGSINSSTHTVKSGGVLWVNGAVGPVTVESGAKLKGSGTVSSLRVNSNGLVKITATNTWDTAGPITLDSGAKIDVTDIAGGMATNQSYALLRGSSISGTPVLVGSAQFGATVTNNTVMVVSLASLDSDGDGLNDAAELAAGTNPNLADTDGDGLNDGQENSLGTNPNLADTDNDGVNDGQENSLGTNPNLADTDNDGVNDNVELADGTNPNNPYSFKKTQDFSFTGNFQTFTVPAGVTRVSFTLEGADGANFQNGYFVLGGQGGTVTGTLAVRPGDVLHLGVGGGGTGNLGGWNGGGSDPFNNGGAGGGATDIFLNSTAWADLAAIAGGGSGGNSRDGFGGTPADAGVNSGTFLVGGDGNGGGGGGGYFGGRGGGPGWSPGGGTSWVNTNVVTASSISGGSPNGNNGLIQLSFVAEPNPTISQGPLSTNGLVDGSVSFSVTAANPTGDTVGLTYQWSKDGAALSGETNNILSLSGLKVDRAGNYRVAVSNPFGSMTSSVATLIVTKATPVVTWATPAAITYGTVLSGSQLNATGSVPGAFAYSPTSGSVLNAGTNLLSAVFTASDTNNYASPLTNTVSLVVNKAISTITATGTPGFPYNGIGQGPDTSTLTGSTGAVTYSYVGTAGTTYGPSPVKPTLVGSYLVTATVAADANFEGASSSAYLFTINDGDADGDGISDTTELSVGMDPLNPSDRPVALSAGWNHALYLPVPGGEALAWGINVDGRCGLGNTNSPVTSGVRVKGPGGITLSNLVAVAAGGSHSLVLQITNGTRKLYAAGINRNGQLGLPAFSSALFFTEVTANGPTNVIGMVAGGRHSLILGADGKVYGFGDNGSGQVGVGVSTMSIRTNTEISGLSGIRAIAAGSEHSLALDSSGNVWAWGRGNSGQLGYQTLSGTNIPRQITGLSGVKQIAAGDKHSLFLTTSGQVYACGLNTAGQLGLGSSVTNTSVPTLISFPAGTVITKLVTGLDRAHAIAADGKVYAWGYNVNGELGLGSANTNATVPTPTEVPALLGSKEIAGGAYQTFALDASGTLLAVGLNEGGQLGIGSTNKVTTGPAPTTEAGKSGQTISFAAINIPGPLTVGADVVLGGSASSGLPLVYGISNTNLASVSNNILTCRGVGTMAVTAYQPGNTNFNAAAPVSVSNLVVGKGTPVITWNNPLSISYGTPLSSAQLNATSVVPGTFKYSPQAGSILPAGTKTLTVNFLPSDTNNYLAAISSVEVMVEKVAPSITGLAASSLTYGQPLGSATLNGSATSGTNSVPGTFAFTMPSLVPNAGTTSQSVIFTPTDTANYNPVTTNVSVTVSKATPNITVVPMASAITYGQTLAASSLTGGSANVAGAFAFTTPTSAPSAGTSSQSVTFTPSDTSNYNSVTTMVSVTVNRVSPVITMAPTATPITYGQTLTDSTLTGGSVSAVGSPLSTGPSMGSGGDGIINPLPSSSLAGTFAFTTPTTAPNAGNANQSVTFTPTDTANYSTVTTSVPVTVSQKALSITGISGKNKEYNGNKVAEINGLAVLTGKVGTDDVSLTGDLSFEFLDAQAGTNKAILVSGGSLSGSKALNYQLSLPTDLRADITAKPIRVVAQAMSRNFGEADPTLIYTADPLVGGDSFTGALSREAGENVGPYAVQPGTLSAGANYSLSFTSADFTILAASASLSLGDLTQTYDTTPKGVSFTTSPTNLPVLVTYDGSTNPPSAAGNYTVVGTINHPNYTGSATNLFTIRKAQAVLSWGAIADITYGTLLTAVQLNASAGIDTGEWVYSPALGAKLTVGTNQVVATFTPGDTNVVGGTLTNQIVVQPATATLTLGNLSQTFDGTGKAVSVSTSPTNLPLLVTYNGLTNLPTNAGSYAVQVSVVDANYTGSATNNLVIAQATPTILSAPTAGAITYGQTLASSALSGGSAEVEGSFSFTTSTTTPEAGTASQGVTFTPTDTNNYTTATTSVSVTVNPASQSINFTLVSSVDYASGGSLSLSATGGGSGNPVTFSSSDSSIASVNGNTLNLLQPGTVTITASQLGGPNHNVATPVERALTIRAPQNVSLAASTANLTFGASLDLAGRVNEILVSENAVNQAIADLNPGGLSRTLTLSGRSAVRPYQVELQFSIEGTGYGANLGDYYAYLRHTTATDLVGQTVVLLNRLGTSVSDPTGSLADGINAVFSSETGTDLSTAADPASGPLTGTYRATGLSALGGMDPNGAWTLFVEDRSSGGTGRLAGWGLRLTEVPMIGSSGPSTVTYEVIKGSGLVTLSGSTVTASSGTGTVRIRATAAASAAYADGQAEVTLTLQKKPVTVALAPSASAIDSGQALIASTLSGGSVVAGTTPVSGSFGWSSPSTVPAATGSYAVTFTPSESNNYETATTNVPVTVNVPTTPFANNVNFTSTASLINVPMPSAAVGGMTLEFWIKPSSTLSPGTYRVVSKNSSTGKAELAIDFKSYSSTSAEVIATLSPLSGSPTVASVALGNPSGWTHFSMVMYSSSVQLFADGVPGSTFSFMSDMNWGTQPMVFGNGFRGQLDDIRIYSGSRTLAQILADKANPATAPWGTLAAYYKCDEGIGVNLSDATGKSLQATGSNIAWGPGRSPGAWDIASGDYSLGNDGSQLLLELGGLEGTTLYDQIFVRNGAATLDGIVNLMFLGTYTGPVSGSWHTFDLIWAQNGIQIGDNYQLIFNQPGYTVDTAVVQKDGGELWQVTVREAATSEEIAAAAALARPALGLAKSPGPNGAVEMMYTYTRPTGGTLSAGQYVVGGVRYELQASPNLTTWTNVAVEPVSTTPAADGQENATVRVLGSGAKTFLRLKVSN